MANLTDRFTYVYGASSDYKVYLKRRRMEKEMWQIKGLSWTYDPEVLTRNGWGRTDNLMADQKVTGSLHLYPWNYMPGIEQVFYVDDTLFVEESGAKYYQNTNPADTATYTANAALVGTYIDRGFGTLYLDNYLEIHIERTQNDASDPNTSPFDRTILTKVRFESVTEAVNFGDVPPVDLKFTAYARPYQDLAAQMIGSLP